MNIESDMKMDIEEDLFDMEKLLLSLDKTPKDHKLKIINIFTKIVDKLDIDEYYKEFALKNIDPYIVDVKIQDYTKNSGRGEIVYSTPVGSFVIDICVNSNTITYNYDQIFDKDEIEMLIEDLHQDNNYDTITYYENDIKDYLIAIISSTAIMYAKNNNNWKKNL